MVNAVYSNFDHRLDETELKSMKQDGKERQHAAYDFCGYIKYNQKDKMFIERIMRFHVEVTVIKHADINDCITEANERYGSN